MENSQDPVTFYHGSPSKFDKFSLQQHVNGSAMGYGVYLTKDKERAKGYSEGKYLYEVQVNNDVINNSRVLSYDGITLKPKEVSKLVQGVAKQQIQEDGYPYVLSDWGEPSSDTEIDDGNKQLCDQIAEYTISTSNDDLDIVNEFANEMGGGQGAADVLNPLLKDMNIHYATKDFDEKSKEYAIFNPDDAKIVKITDIEHKRSVRLVPESTVQAPPKPSDLVSNFKPRQMSAAEKDNIFKRARQGSLAPTNEQQNRTLKPLFKPTRRKNQSRGMDL
jgi:hypothetical protein